MTKKEITNSSKPKKSTVLAHTKTKLKKGNQASATKPNPKPKSKPKPKSNKLVTVSLNSLLKMSPKSPSPMKGTQNLRENYNKKYGNQVPNYSKNVKK